jgi:archaemetzincin
MRQFYLALPLGVLIVSNLVAGTVLLPTLVIQPLGDEICIEDIDLVQEAIHQFYDMPVRVQPRLGLPKEAFYEPRHRYRAERLLPFLKINLPEDGHRILGLTEEDISTSKGIIEDWGVIGLAVASGRECIISSYRCRLNARDEFQARVRLGKVAVHEVGHTLGLPHCPTAGCLMQDARGSVRVCDGAYDLCIHCRNQLKLAGILLPENPIIPWPKP